LELDLHQGTLTRHLHWQDPDGRRTSVVQRRFVSMKDPHLAGLQTTFTAENWSGALEVWSGLDGRVVNAGVRRYRDLNGQHLNVLDAAEAGDELIELQVETTQSRIRVALAARTRLLLDGEPVAADRSVVSEPGFVAHALRLKLEQARRRPSRRSWRCIPPATARSPKVAWTPGWRRTRRASTNS
jgi:trehalose/maltose hydrolase-like predicted phosphorylase